MLKLLLTQKADVQAADSYGNTPLDVARANNYDNLSKLIEPLARSEEQPVGDDRPNARYLVASIPYERGDYKQANVELTKAIRSEVQREFMHTAAPATCWSHHPVKGGGPESPSNMGVADHRKMRRPKIGGEP